MVTRNCACVEPEEGACVCVYVRVRVGAALGRSPWLLHYGKESEVIASFLVYFSIGSCQNKDGKKSF